jgi:hypothetical protein
LFLLNNWACWSTAVLAMRFDPASVVLTRQVACPKPWRCSRTGQVRSDQQLLLLEHARNVSQARCASEAVRTLVSRDRIAAVFSVKCTRRMKSTACSMERITTAGWPRTCSGGAMAKFGMQSQRQID